MKKKNIGFAGEVIVYSVVTYVVIYIWQIVKYLFTSKIEPTALDIVLSFILGVIISHFLMKLIR